MMTSAIEELRHMLDERGVEWWESRGYATGIVYTFWNSPTFGRVHAIENNDGTLFVACLNNCTFTPAQAIAATLGSMSATIDDALSLLDEMNEQGCIKYVDYSQLHDAIAATLGAGTTTMTTDVGSQNWYSCDTCDADGYAAVVPNYCPNCGRRIIITK